VRGNGVSIFFIFHDCQIVLTSPGVQDFLCGHDGAVPPFHNRGFHPAESQVRDDFPSCRPPQLPAWILALAGRSCGCCVCPETSFRLWPSVLFGLGFHQLKGPTCLSPCGAASFQLPRQPAPCGPQGLSNSFTCLSQLDLLVNESDAGWSLPQADLGKLPPLHHRRVTPRGRF